MELRLSPEQREVWSKMEIDGKAVTKMAFTKLESLWEGGWTMEREMFVDSALKEVMSTVTFLQEHAVRGLLRESHDRFSSHIKAAGKPLFRGRMKLSFDIGPDEMILSSSEPVVSVPYLGKVKLLPNDKINAYVGSSAFQSTDHKAVLWSNLRRVRLEIWNNRHVMTVDCSSDAEVKERDQKGVDKMTKRRRSKMSTAGSRWLDG